MENIEIEQMRRFWPEWEIISEIGRGAYGTIYKAVSRESGTEKYSAIKVIAIPRDQSELNLLRSEGFDNDSARTYLYKVVVDFVNEINMMESLKGNRNIVSIEDYNVIEKGSELGWLIYIRMELLKPFVDYILYNSMDGEQVRKLGIDICSALEVCETKNIIHRDIKPDNVFLNEAGDFKLGDFGIARRIENVTHGLSKKGTFNYMAPEVAREDMYDARVDIYSLGIMLYRFLNNNHLPFIQTEDQNLDYNYKREAVERRMQGEMLPPPCNASSEMSRIVLKACDYNPANRFSSAREMKEALLAVRHANTGAFEYSTEVIADSKTPTNVRTLSSSCRKL